MGVTPVCARPQWAPSSFGIGKIEYDFEGVAPITGDALYVGMRKSEIVHAIHTNPDARRRQTEYFVGGGKR